MPRAYSHNLPNDASFRCCFELLRGLSNIVSLEVGAHSFQLFPSGVFRGIRRLFVIRDGHFCAASEDFVSRALVYVSPFGSVWIKGLLGGAVGAGTLV